MPKRIFTNHVHKQTKDEEIDYYHEMYGITITLTTVDAYNRKTRDLVELQATPRSLDYEDAIMLLTKVTSSSYDEGAHLIKVVNDADTMFRVVHGLRFERVSELLMEFGSAVQELINYIDVR